ncbi:unnamed protein product [Didymodactylos carnosus]|uniref:Uncharacterized protein n=1 Tax=Didymodactylos carnosus TaxID=1234261 RepID=A0A813SY67_9BILA|nr:unnamed protein product [Didymodactylos carnosus]CAF0804326.1 unnamed protein product [Didymodactylos carnosus]CAF3556769.1 unnamed protein product [Didymodactylos carnosus]CAF3589535.1 unnamed protein product [Didymodactylos carnosus]
MSTISHIRHFFLLLIAIKTIYCQTDPTICPEGSITKPDDPRWHQIHGRFEISGEYVLNDGAFEVSQAFTLGRDAIFVTINGVPFQHYYNFETKEYFTLSTLILDQAPVPLCARSIITDQFATSNISAGVVKPSILLGFDTHNKPNELWATRLLGEGVIRGIPVDIFTSCFYVPDIKATISATYFYSNVTKFVSNLGRGQPILVRIDVKSIVAGSRQDYTFNIFRFTPHPRMNEEIRALQTPSGFFCENRTNTKHLPRDIPERLSVNSEVQFPAWNHSILSGHEMYDKQSEFVRFDAYLGRFGHYTEIHDYITGLNYRYEHRTQRCTVTDITVGYDAQAAEGQPNFVRMSDGLEFFLIEGLLFHYTGVHRCGERINCHVWLGEKVLTGATKGVQRREWYWAFEVNGFELPNMIPMKLILTDVDERGRQTQLTEINMYNYNRNPIATFEVDYTLSECYRALGPKKGYHYGVVKFTIENDKNYPVQKNIQYLQFTIWYTLTVYLQLRPVRISNIIIDHEDKDLLVTFTLLDVPPKYGPVEHPLHEHTLATLIERLERMINNNLLAFRAKYGTKEVELRARKNSLAAIFTNEKTVIKSSGMLITGLWIGFLVFGILIGVGATFIIVKKYTSN